VVVWSGKFKKGVVALSFVYLRDATETLTKSYQLAKVGQIDSPLEFNCKLDFLLTIELKSVLCIHCFPRGKAVMLPSLRVASANLPTPSFIYWNKKFFSQLPAEWCLMVGAYQWLLKFDGRPIT
jgi:hypothetical protein